MALVLFEQGLPVVLHKSAQSTQCPDLQIKFSQDLRDFGEALANAYILAEGRIEHSQKGINVLARPGFSHPQQSFEQYPACLSSTVPKLLRLENLFELQGVAEDASFFLLSFWLDEAAENESFGYFQGRLCQS